MVTQKVVLMIAGCSLLPGITLHSSSYAIIENSFPHSQVQLHFKYGWLGLLEHQEGE